MRVEDYAHAHHDEWVAAVEGLLDRYALKHGVPEHGYDVPEVWEPLIRIIKDPWADDAVETVERTVEWLRGRCQYEPGTVEEEIMDGLGELYYTGQFARVVWPVVLIRDGRRCAYCGRPDDPDDPFGRLVLKTVGSCWMCDDPSVHRVQCWPCHRREEDEAHRRLHPQATLDAFRNPLPKPLTPFYHSSAFII